MAKDVPFELVPQPHELRIGNILSYKGDLVHVTLLSMDIDDEYQEIIGFCKLGKSTNEISNWNRVMAGDLLRVPLDAEILEACGFRSEYIDHYRHPNLHFLGHYYLPYKVFKDAAYYSMDNPTTEYVKIEYLHQLQNLVHSITRKELTVNLPQPA